MKTAIVLALYLVFSFAQAQGHDHQSSPNKKTESKSVGSKEFKPTKDLKVRMEKILSLMKELEKRKGDVNTVKQYGEKLTDSVNDIFKTCKLEPAADAAIHPSLALILEGSGDFKNGQYDVGHSKIHEALLNYEKLFKHEGWKH